MGMTLTPALPKVAETILSRPSRQTGEGESWPAFCRASSGGSGLFWQPTKRL